MYDNQAVLIVVHTLQFVRVWSPNYVNAVHCVMFFAHYLEVSLTYSVSEVWLVKLLCARRSTDGQKGKL